MSSGYTRAFASTAPVEPAMAAPHGGSSLDCPAIVFVSGVVKSDRGGESVVSRDQQSQLARISGLWRPRMTTGSTIDKSRAEGQTVTGSGGSETRRHCRGEGEEAGLNGTQRSEKVVGLEGSTGPVDPSSWMKEADGDRG
jgi:hypothetical protein